MVHRHRLLIAGLVLALAAALALTAAGRQPSLAADGIIYVDADAPGPTHDGSTWDFAYTDLQDALADADPGQQIWVAEGTYKPSVEYGGSGDRYRSFQLKNGVALYGGFDPSLGDVAIEDRD
jgi:hypothetical protein